MDGLSQWSVHSSAQAPLVTHRTPEGWCRIIQAHTQSQPRPTQDQSTTTPSQTTTNQPQPRPTHKAKTPQHKSDRPQPAKPAILGPGPTKNSACGIEARLPVRNNVH